MSEINGTDGATSIRSTNAAAAAAAETTQIPIYANLKYIHTKIQSHKSNAAQPRPLY